jgi:hypothetical protein
LSLAGSTKPSGPAGQQQDCAPSGRAKSAAEPRPSGLWSRRDFVRHGALAAGVVCCGPKEAPAAAAGAAVVTPEAEILAQVNPARPLRGGLIPSDIARRLGAAHVGGRYYFTEKPFLLEGAERVHALGLGGIKLWFSELERGYAFNSSWNLPSAPTLVQLARHPYFTAAFALPFAVIALEINAVRTDSAASGARRDLIDPQYDVAVDEEQMYALTRHLYQTYGERDVTFLLQNWEGDWLFRGGARDGWMRGEYPKLDQRVAGYIRWFTARQRGVERARAEYKGARCQVWHAIEVNRVFDLRKGIPTLTTHVLPHVRPDLISWSCYDGLNTGARNAEKSAVGIWQGLDLIQRHAQTTRQDFAGRPAVYIGEFGFPENVTTPAGAVEMMDGALGTMLVRRIPYLLYWEVFCNERLDGTRPKPLVAEKAAELRGFWLVRPDGSLGGVGQYLARLLAHAGGRLPVQ